MTTTMMFWALLCCSARGEMDLEQFLSLQKAASEAIQDVSFLYEGELTLQPPGRARGLAPDGVNVRFQGSYDYRISDNAVAWDLFTNKVRHNEVMNGRSITTFLKSKQEILTMSPDRQSVPPPSRVLQVNGVRPFQMEHHSPEDFLFLRYFKIMKMMSQEYDFRFENWDEIDGGKCARVLVNLRNLPLQHRLWVDLQRNGQVVQWHLVVNDQVSVAFEKLNLRRVTTLDGKLVWFPTGCEKKSFMIRGEHLKEPYLLETRSIIEGSLRINQVPPDSRFQTQSILKRNEKGPFVSVSSPLPPFRSDPEGVRATLERRLEEADQAANLLAASQAIRDERDLSWLYHGALIFLGVCFIVLAVWIRRRM